MEEEVGGLGASQPTGPVKPGHGPLPLYPLGHHPYQQEEESEQDQMEATIYVPRILCPLDFSPISPLGLRYGHALAHSMHATLHLLTVLPLEGQTMTEEEREEKTKKLVARMETVLNEVCEEQNYSVVIDVVWGRADRCIIQYADDHHISLIVMPTHGRNGLDKFFLGSITDRVIQQAPCPVLTMRPEARHFLVGS